MLGRRLSEIRFVDLKRSKVDWEKSQPQSGKYVFRGDPAYVDYVSDEAPLPDHKVQWVNHNPYNVDRWRYKYGYEIVKWQDKLYWPEGFEPNAEGRYQYRDTILMMCPADVYVERKRKEIERSERATRSRQAEFRAAAAHDGIEVYDQDEVREMRKLLQK